MRWLKLQKKELILPSSKFFNVLIGNVIGK